MDKSQIEDIFPLTPMQEGLLFQALFDNSSSAYFLQMTLNWQGELRLDVFEQSWQLLSARHPVLRSLFVHEGVKRPYQVALKHRPPHITYTNLCHLPAAEQEAAIAQYQANDQAQGFDLQKDVLLRLAVFQLEAQMFRLVWSYHHILFDGWSYGILQQEFIAIYQALCCAEHPLLPITPPYRQYIRWLQAQNRETAVSYWRTYLDGYEQIASLPHLLPTTQIYQFAQQMWIADEATTHQLQQTAVLCGVTLNSLVRAVWAVLLGRYTQSDDVLFGAIVSGRPSGLPGVEEMVGLFINAVPVRARLAGADSFAALARQLQQDALTSEAHHYLPLAEIQTFSPLGRDLFDHLLIFENYPLNEETADSPHDFAIEGVGVHDRTHYDLDITITPGRQLVVQFNYNSAVYPDDQMERVVGHWETAVKSILADPQTPLAYLNILPGTEREQLLVGFAGPQREYPVDQTIPHLFEVQAAHTPERIAVSHNGRSLTYQQLNEQANQLAHTLRQGGLQPNQFVAILEERGLEFLVAILGTLKAGAAYIPLDPSYPDDRVQYMLTNSQAEWLITQHSVNSTQYSVSSIQYPVSSTQYPVPSIQYPVPSIQYPISNPPPVNSPRDRAYMLYTSGSTGLPKGAIIRHDGAINHIYGQFELLKFHPDTAFLQSAPSSSDISVWQFLGPVLCGGRCVVTDLETVADPARLLQLIQQEHITLIELVPVVLKGLLDYAATLPPDKAALPHLEWAMVTGEAVQAALINQWLATYPDIPIVNAYGPTEAADDVSQQVIRQPLPLNGRSVSIGRPLPNLHILILDRHNQLVPIGVAGEICVAGIGVGEGYWRNPQKTAESFVQYSVFSTPYSVKEKQGTDHWVLGTGHWSLGTIYRTGDRGRWLPDGTIEFWGRQDDQVKLRGYRIELGEIEARLLQVIGVETAVVLLKGQQLVAYLAGQPQKTSYLRQQLRHLLPDHMIPSQFIWLDTLPLTPNGKVDKKRLRQQEDGAYTPAIVYVPPRNSTESQLVDIWAEVLAAKQVGIHNNFFDLGGHSLKAMQTVSRIHQGMNVKLSLRDFFAHPTIAEQARLITTSQTDVYAAIHPAPARSYYPLSHAQKRLWLQHQLDKTGAYNMPEAYLIEDELDVDALERTFRDIIQRHEALRTAFVLVNGEPVQQILPTVPFAIRRLDLSGEMDAEQTAKTVVDEEASRLFDLRQPPLLRATFIKLAESRHIFVLTVHHIIGDGWSGTVLYQEIMALYEAHRQKRPNPLPPLRIQYKDFALWQLEKGFAREETYWLAKLAGVPDYLRLPTDFPIPLERNFRGSTVQVVINGRITQNLRALAQKQQTTLANVVLSLFKLLLYQATKQADLCVGVAIANRNHPDLENLLGFFVNILPLRTHLSDEMEFADLLNQVTEGMNQAFEYQDYPFDLLVEKLNPTRFANRTPILNVMYGFQSFGDVVVGGKGAENSGNGRLSSFHFSFETAKFDLTLFVLAESEGMTLTLEYDTSLFKPQTIQRYLNAMARFAEKVSN